MNVPMYEELLNKIRKQHIAYTLKVGQVVGIELSTNDKSRIQESSYEEAILLSAEAEKLYKSYIGNLGLEKLLKESEELGLETFLEKYSLERTEQCD